VKHLGVGVSLTVSTDGGKTQPGTAIRATAPDSGDHSSSVADRRAAVWLFVTDAGMATLMSMLESVEHGAGDGPECFDWAGAGAVEL
jgi:hypothetical protein